MVECDYCDETFADAEREDEEFVTHLAEEHRDELTRIDRRMVEDNWDGDLDDLSDDDYRLSSVQIGVAGAVCTFFLGIIVVALL